MDIATLKTFLELSRTHHFGKAANDLFITQSAVSARIKQLEDNLGVKLLTRDRNNIQLTPAGVHFLPLAEQIVNTWTIARQTTALEEEKQILLSLGAIHGIWDAGLLDSVSLFYLQNDAIALNLEAHSQEQLFRKLRENSVDVGFMYEQPQLAELKAEPIGHLELVLVTTYQERDLQTLLTNHNYLYVDWGTEFANTHARHFPNLPPINFRVNWGRLALSYLKAHDGSAYLPRQMINFSLKNKRLCIVEAAPIIKREYYAVYPVKSHKQTTIEALITRLKQSAIEAR